MSKVTWYDEPSRSVNKELTGLSFHPRGCIMTMGLAATGFGVRPYYPRLTSEVAGPGCRGLPEDRPK